MPTQDCHQNPPLSCRLHRLSPLWLFCSSLFAFLCNVSFFIAFETFPCFLFFLLSSKILHHVSVFVAVETLWFSVFEIVVGSSNIHWLSSTTICGFCACLVIMVSLHWFVSLSYWCYCYLLLFKNFWHRYQWVSQYCLDDILSCILLQ